MHLEIDVLVIGAGGAGMYAAIEAARSGASVILADRSLIGRGGATVMAQMTVAVALGEQVPDHWEAHYADTLTAGRGLCNERLAATLTEGGPARILEMDEWKVGWARENDHIKQAHAPGHDRPRCVYVDFLSTGPAVSKTLRTKLNTLGQVRRIGDLYITDVIVDNGEARGALAVHVPTNETVTIASKATVVATGGLTRLYRRNSASLNMGGDGYALAMRAGAQLIDMEFVQFFPIGHLAPRMIGMDPIMWDPFRYKLGGKLLNSEMREFEDDYQVEAGRDDGRYVLTRDRATYAIFKEVEAGRGSPAGGAYLSFEHIPEEELRHSFGPVIDRLASNGIDLTKRPVEVAPIAHYHMGGVRVDDRLESGVRNLFVCGEAVGGANGANRLSGNAITEALVFGYEAGRNAAARAAETQLAWSQKSAQPQLDVLSHAERHKGPNPAALIESLQTLMSTKVGPFRTGAKLQEAVSELEELSKELGTSPAALGERFDPVLADWLDLRNMLLVAKSVTYPALARMESRGAHQREDYPGMDDSWAINQIVSFDNDAIRITRETPVRLAKQSAT